MTTTIDPTTPTLPATDPRSAARPGFGRSRSPRARACRCRVRTAALGLLAGLALAAAAGSAEPSRLAPPVAGDLVTTELAALGEAPPAAVPEVPHESAAFTYRLDPGQPLPSRPEPYRAESREYWQQVSADELARGVPLYTTAPGALVRISPVATPEGARPATVDPARLVLEPPAGEPLEPGRGMDRLAGTDALREAGMGWPRGTAAFRVDPALGAGRFVLRLPEAAKEARWRVHVVDDGSDLALTLTAGEATLVAGDELTVASRLLADDAPVAADEIEGFVTAPDGRLWPIVFEPDGAGGWRAATTVASASATPGLWEVHARVAAHHRGLAAVRSVRAPFAVAAPTARFTGDAAVERPVGEGARLRIELAVATAAAGRYEARGVLCGTAADGTVKPLVAVHAAAWFEPGAGVLTLEVPPDQLAAPDLGPPWELRDLRLLDQGRMGLLHRQAEALTIP